ncbi:hypothetical protein GPEL0_01r4144 [Geoanaerobacter pelophilus]|uniref:Uncharacterized protein n=1 Tax=Geoanaerobacter pelophilus TaxID=60036 RepID=A0ABQ0MLS9_9BACT|nr:hypothetical protein GPEL0_01r4144 [Geoanaerobacter pelophilus]
MTSFSYQPAATISSGSQAGAWEPSVVPPLVYFTKGSEASSCLCVPKLELEDEDTGPHWCGPGFPAVIGR